MLAAVPLPSHGFISIARQWLDYQSERAAKRNDSSVPPGERRAFSTAGRRLGRQRKRRHPPPSSPHALEPRAPAFSPATNSASIRGVTLSGWSWHAASRLALTRDARRVTLPASSASRGGRTVSRMFRSVRAMVASPCQYRCQTSAWTEPAAGEGPESHRTQVAWSVWTTSEGTCSRMPDEDWQKDD